MDARKMQDAESSGGARGSRCQISSSRDWFWLSLWGSAGTPPVPSSPQFPPAQLDFSKQ